MMRLTWMDIDIETYIYIYIYIYLIPDKMYNLIDKSS